METLPYRTVVAWQKAYALAREIADLSDQHGFRKEPDNRRQLRRAAWSVGANIAEGHGRGTALGYAAFLDRARGSLFEVDHWLLASADLGLLDRAEFGALGERVSEVNAIIHALRARLRRNAVADNRLTV